MRAHRLRPTFDSLDIRLVLSDSGATAVSGANLGSTVLTAVNPAPPTPPDITTITTWYQDGTPTTDPNDGSTLVPVPYDSIIN